MKRNPDESSRATSIEELAANEFDNGLVVPSVHKKARVDILGENNHDPSSVCGTTLDAVLTARFGGQVTEFIEAFHDYVLSQRDGDNTHSVVQAFAVQHDMPNECIPLLQSMDQVLENKTVDTNCKIPNVWKEALEVYLLLQTAKAQEEESGHAPARSKSGAPCNENTQPMDTTPNDTTTLLQREVSNECTDSQRSDDEQRPDSSVAAPSSPKRTPPKGSQGSLDALVAKKYQGDFFCFFDCILEEMQAPTFSFSGFTRRNGVPRARETLRNIACYLRGEPTKQFLAEAWRKRVQAYLEMRGSKGAQSDSSIHKSSENCVAAVVTPNHGTGDISRSQKRARIRGREGALDGLVMDKFHGNFFEFLAFVEQEMHRPGFTPTGFVRAHEVPRGRETLRHIVSHLKQECTSSDRLLAQMWKDRIRVYMESKTSGQVQKIHDDQVPESGMAPEAVNIYSV